MSRKGFTLLEMSIVLIIIGLIIGGILVGSEMIENSRINSLVADTRRYNTAINAFKLKYNGMPGDLKNATAFFGTEAGCPGVYSTDNLPGTCNGDGDNEVEWNSWNGLTDNDHYRFWEHLVLANMIAGQYTGRPALNAGQSAALSDVNLPSHQMGGRVVYATKLNASASTLYSKTGGGYTFYSIQSTYFLTPTQQAGMDAKHDDGKPGTGTITTFAPASPSTTTCASSPDSATAVYNIAQNTVICSPLVWDK